MVFNVLSRFNEVISNKHVDIENKGLVLLSAVECVSINLTEVLFELLQKGDNLRNGVPRLANLGRWRVN